MENKVYGLPFVIYNESLGKPAESNKLIKTIRVK